MSKRRYSLSITLILCLVLQGSGMSFASANGVADCGMALPQMEMMSMNMQQDGHDHSAMLPGQMPSVSMSDASDEQISVEADCCDVDGITRGDCTDMPDCHSCGSLISLSIPNSTATLGAAEPTQRRWLHPPSTRTFSPPDLWRPPITA